MLKRISNYHSLSLPQQQMQATSIHEEEIRMSINLPYVEGTGENLRRILRSHKIRSTFYIDTEAHCINYFVNGKIVIPKITNSVTEDWIVKIIAEYGVITFECVSIDGTNSIEKWR